MNFYEGDSTKTHNRQECYDAIAKASYEGPKRNFDFNSYVSIHQQAHQYLIRLVNPYQKTRRLEISSMESQICNAQTLSSPF
jgi:hypothetical protein